MSTKQVDLGCMRYPRLGDRLERIYCEIKPDREDAPSIPKLRQWARHLEALPDTPGAWYEVIGLFEALLSADSDSWVRRKAVLLIIERCRQVAADWPIGLEGTNTSESDTRGIRPDDGFDSNYWQREIAEREYLEQRFREHINFLQVVRPFRKTLLAESWRALLLAAVKGRF